MRCKRYVSGWSVEWEAALHLLYADSVVKIKIAPPAVSCGGGSLPFG
ncbi:protein of unknown function [Maridesulfovibrio hydrothermalis AM13 = DSM 14728]|uniref:Uncharacterized protein n=1 Tax=Maridesulfovibrio hydrothermalis AM13 = DSM 14728 TaxID=1121451 RepID=L0R631_9BACT|nr:protein of unknown function [Maridesulfovibrio hydrothermalis AM13 = DSM 14728]